MTLYHKLFQVLVGCRNLVTISLIAASILFLPTKNGIKSQLPPLSPFCPPQRRGRGGGATISLQKCLANFYHALSNMTFEESYWEKWEVLNDLESNVPRLNL